MTQKKNWWESYPAAGGQAAPAGGVVVQPGSPLQTSKTAADVKQSEAGAAASAAQANRVNVLLPSEQREAAAKATKAEIEAAEAAKQAAKPKPPSAEQAAFDTTVSNMKAAVDTINLLTRQFNQTLAGRGLVKSTLEYLPTQEKGAINATGAGLADVGFAVFKVPGAGSQSDKDAERFVAANQPSTTDFDYTYLGKLYNLRRRLDAKARSMGFAPIEWVEPNAKAARDYLALPEEERRAIGVREVGTFRDIPAELAPETAPAAKAAELPSLNAPSGLSVMPERGVDRSAPLPGRTNEPELKTAEAGSELGITDVDKEYTSRLQQAFDSGYSAEDLQKLAKEFYGNDYAIDPARLNAAIEYRDDYLKKGGRGPSGALILPRERKLTQEEMKRVEAINDPVNAFLAKTGSALVGNQAANITGLFDPEKAEKQRASLDMYSEASPIASFGGTFAGSIPAALTTAAGLTRLGLSPSLAALVGDVAYGGISGAGENRDNPMLGALFGAGTAGTGSLVGRYGIAPVVEAGAQGVRKIAPLFGKYTNIPAKPSYADETFATGLGNADEATAVLSEAERLGLPMSAADVSTPAQTLGRQVARRSTKVAEGAEGALAERASGRVDRLKDAISKFVGQPYDDLRAAEAEIEKAADDAADPLYRKALDRPAPVDDKIDALLDTTLGRKGLQQAYVYAESRGVDPKALGFSLDDQGAVSLVQKPSWETLHYIRRGLQREIDQYRDPVTRSLDTKNPAIDNAQNFLRRFDKRLDYLNPDYASAKAAWSQYIAPRDYLEQGVKALDPNTPPADVERVLARINAMPEGTPEQAALKAKALESYQRGFATAQRAAVDNARNADPYAVIMGTPRQRAKLDLIAPGAQDFTKSAELEGRMLATEKVMAPSPQAAGRAEAEAGLTKADLLGAIGETALTGTPTLTSANLVRNAMAQPGVKGWFADTFGLGSPFRAAKRAEEIAPDLLRQDPRGALDRIAAAEQTKEAYNQFAQPLRFEGTLTGGLAANALGAEAGRDEQYTVAPQPLSEDITVRMTFGNGAQVNPDGSVTTAQGMTVPPERVREEVAKTAKLITPYYGQ